MKGTCLCGAIEVIAEPKNEVSLCHCSMFENGRVGHFMPCIVAQKSHLKVQSQNVISLLIGQYEVFAASVGRTCFTTSCQPTNTSFLLAYSIILILS